MNYRTRSVVAIGLAFGFVVGLWAGVLILPAEALDVPTSERTAPGGETNERVAFYPIGQGHFLLTVTAIVAAAWYASTRWERDDRRADVLEDESGERPTATDGGDELEEATNEDVHEAIPA